jgi:hypothetical protein
VTVPQLTTTQVDHISVIWAESANHLASAQLVSQSFLFAAIILNLMGIFS